jgi:hypothetical protein
MYYTCVEYPTRRVGGGVFAENEQNQRKIMVEQERLTVKGKRQAHDQLLHNSSFDSLFERLFTAYTEESVVSICLLQERVECCEQRQQ